jgi:hypothetical protein
VRISRTCQMVHAHIGAVVVPLRATTGTHNARRSGRWHDDERIPGERNIVAELADMVMKRAPRWARGA